MTPASLKTKLKNAIRIDRALRFVWQASKVSAILQGLVVAFLGMLPIASLYLVKMIIDQVAALALSPPSNFMDPAFYIVVKLILAACGIGLLTALLNFAADYIKKFQAQTVADYMYAVLHEQSCRVDLAFFESPEYRDTLFRAQQEGPYRPTNIVSGLFAAGQAGASFVAVAWLLAMLNPLFPLIMIAAAVPGVLLRLKYSGKIYEWQEKRTEDERRAYYFHWMLTGDAHAKEFRLFNLGRYFIERFRQIRSTLKEEKLWFERRRAMGDFIAQASSLICVFGSFAYIAFRAARGEITIGDLVMYFQAFQRGLGFLKTLLETGAEMYEDNLFLSHFYEFLKVKPDVKSPLLPVPVPEKIKTGIEFKTVDFSYHKNEKKVLNCVNFSISPGEIIALVGKNGSGKSTIVKMLTRLYDPQKGGVYLDGINIKKFDIGLFRKKISVVFQDHIKYYLTAGENILLGDMERDADAESIRTAAAESGIDKKISRLPDEYDTLLGRWFKNGEELSIGQWQMLAISRAFFRDAEIVVLDEPSSALDPEAEKKLFVSLRRLMQNRSALIISHRYSTVRQADRILVMDQGRIIEQGSHDDLMGLNGEYARLYNTQAKGYTTIKEDVN
ncbi:ABC transporter ATP-binding protein [uncultured Desulfobacter sp.]|uniref:ABC transporter ATP-binding protein n=1 Tax=uncultured Desulfobacter sp. TaxID=240139 RepID=UPI0029C6497B|nr:ABC transporter ATP-binding protein [uncultured Desulfobacter sp.]